MSLFRKVDVPCPSCGGSVPFELVFSVNAKRRPDLREEILRGTFQSQTCSACGKTFRVQPEFNYVDIGRGLWVAAFPLEKRGDWQVHEDHAEAIFQKSYGRNASQAARALGANLTKRLTFGWSALREKIVAFDAGLDDITIELCKLAVIRGLADQPLGDETELRLIDFEGEDLILAWIVSVSERLIEQLRVPRSLYDEVSADSASWSDLRNDLSQGMLVDLDRAMIVSQ